MSKIQLGPLSEVHFALLKEKLESHGAGFQRFEDAELLRSFVVATRHKPLEGYPSFSGLPEYIYIEIEKEHVLLIKNEIDRIAISIRPESPEPDGEESILPQSEAEKKVAKIFTRLLLGAALLAIIYSLITSKSR